ncbi:hypothetical protein RRG08_042327 [Elysia crispata]|uniref:C-type lectin domain-containing protein n=1 Tax=Elysia crispata TaxID=231223 RepID=A0AAE0ZKB6_9GAST|nr:hypothetical protein RRG08_042327 [Elysia crispata]
MTDWGSQIKMMGIKDENTKLSTILMMTTYLWSGQATHQVTIECKLLGMNFYLMLLILAAGVNICSCELPQTTSSPASTLIATEGQCRPGWRTRDNFCFKVFDGITERRTYHGAKQFCERRNGELLSKDDVDTYHYTGGFSLL